MMRIAYFLQLNMGTNTGVYKKIISQAEAWIKYGYEVGFFISTKEKDIEDSLLLKEDQFKIFIKYYKKSFLPPPFDGRIKSLNELIAEMVKWSPDIVYTRQDLYLPPISRLVHKFNVITEINTNDLGELNKKNILFFSYYKATRGILLNGSVGHIYVSKEISEERHYANFMKPNITIGNGIDLHSFYSLRSAVNEKPRLVFIGHAGYNWHGLDKIIKLAQIKKEWQFDLIGISKSDLDFIPQNVETHGVMARSEYEGIFEQADCALGTLALHRKGMNEASPLKVREYLAYGLPIIIGYADTDFPNGDPYICNIGNTEDNVEKNIENIERFIKQMRGLRVPRSHISQLDNKIKEAERLAFFETFDQK